MSQPNIKIKRHYILLCLICGFFISTATLIQLSDGLQWASMNTAEVLAGQYWRLISAHLSHLDWQHLSMNMLGLVLCIITFNKDIKPAHWLYSFLFISLFSSLCMFIYLAYDRYVGFSDVLHGWILLGATAIAHKEPKLCLAIYIVFWLKILEENMNLTFFTSYGVSGNVATESHIYGAIGGILYAALFLTSVRHELKRLLLKSSRSS